MNKLTLIALLGVAALATACTESQAQAPKQTKCLPEKFAIVDHSASASSGRVAVVVTARNDNPFPCGLKMQVQMIDSAGKVVMTKESWLSTNNVQPGANISGTVYLPKDMPKGAKDYRVEQFESREWGGMR